MMMDAEIPTSTAAILGLIVAGLITCILLLVRTLAEARGANAAVNNVEGPTISANVQHLVEEVGSLREAQKDFARRGWATLPEPIDTAVGLVTTMDSMRRDIEAGSEGIAQIAQRLAEHDAWERSQKFPPH